MITYTYLYITNERAKTAVYTNTLFKFLLKIYHVTLKKNQVNIVSQKKSHTQAQVLGVTYHYSLYGLADCYSELATAHIVVNYYS
jgi:hypothetical protein